MKPNILNFLHDDLILPQPEVLELSNKNKSLFIGIPREIALQEKRVPLVPETVGLLVNNGHKVYIESKAGEQSSFLDIEYSEAGAKVCKNVNEIYEADIILKVAPPTINELDLFKKGQCLISALQLNTQKKEYFKKLIDKKVTAVGFEYIRDQINSYPIVQRDLNLVMKEDLEAGEIINLILKIGGKYVTRVNPINLFNNPKAIGENKKSITFSIFFQHPSKTLEDKEVNSIINEIINIADKEFSAKLRG